MTGEMSAHEFMARAVLMAQSTIAEAEKKTAVLSVEKKSSRYGNKEMSKELNVLTAAKVSHAQSPV